MNIVCDRLLINDSTLSDESIRECLGRDALYYNIELVNGYRLGEEISERLSTLSRQVDRILLPGYSVSIFLRCTAFAPPSEKILLLPSVKRKLEAMTPRGISISDDDMSRLSLCDPKEEILLLDDVIASGTTANGIAKRIKKPDMKLATLATREPNDLKNTLSQTILSSCTVRPKTVKFPAMNTLSSLRDPDKADTLLLSFRKLYGEQFAQRIQELFPIT